MSGGYYDYAYLRILNIAIKDRKTNPQRAAIQSLTTLYAKVLKEVEWVDSGDTCGKELEEALSNFLNFASSLKSVKDTMAIDVETLRQRHLTVEEIEDENLRSDDDF